MRGCFWSDILVVQYTTIYQNIVKANSPEKKQNWEEMNQTIAQGLKQTSTTSDNETCSHTWY